jgi:tRNA(fMet)-specific endonuclease VapC
LIYCLDTDILIEYFRGNEKIVRKISSLADEDGIALTWLSFYEFFKGIYVSKKPDEEFFLKNRLATCLVLDSSFESSKIGGEIYASLKKEGKLINDADILIASIVKANQATLVTNNSSRFIRISGLQVVNWLTE